MKIPWRDTRENGGRRWYDCNAKGSIGFGELKKMMNNSPAIGESEWRSLREIIDKRLFASSWHKPLLP